MERSNSVGKYILMFEPLYVTYQYAVYFKENGDVQVTKVDKYSDIPYGLNSNKKVKKNLLRDIDRIITPLGDMSDFFDQYIDQSIFRYTGNNLHKMFIGYKHKERMNSLTCSFNNFELFDKTRLINGSKITDQQSIMSLINLMADKNSSFVKFINRTERDRTSNLSNSTLNLINSFKDIECLINEGFYESGLHEEQARVKKELFDRLTSYREFREVFLLKQNYISYLQSKKEELQNVRSILVNNQPENTIFSQEEPHKEYEQLSLFDMLPITTNEVVKTKKLDK